MKTLDSARQAEPIEKELNTLNGIWQKLRSDLGVVFDLPQFKIRKVEVKGENEVGYNFYPGSTARHDPEKYFEEISGITVEEARKLYEGENYFEDFVGAIYFHRLDETSYEQAEEIAHYYWDKFSNEDNDTL